MRRIFSLIVPNAVVALVVVSAFLVSAGIGQARAEDCLAAPNASSPTGQHWYYRIDRVNRRKCWYLHAPLRIAHQAHRASAVSDAKIERSPPPVSMPIAEAPTPERVTNETPPDNALSLPHVTVLAVKTVAVPDPNLRTAAQPRLDAGEPSIARADARAYSATPENKSDPTTFFLLVFGLGVTAFLMTIIVKGVAAQESSPLRKIRPGADRRPEMRWSVKPRPYPSRSA